ncbi:MULTISPECIES: hypothetical protein [unclassified Streptomyces]|uniref:hypothetical protein n=1 Tax=unclassified Streptomyces TaxID=2593676 RepID=UPI003828974F
MAHTIAHAPSTLPPCRYPPTPIPITAEPADESVLATITWSSAERYLGEGADRGGRDPMAVVAERVGGALAARLGVPFHFASPDDPDDEAPRWKPDRGAAQE